MACLTSLPPELIEMICNYIRPMQPMRDHFAKTSHENPIDKDGLQLEWKSLRSLSVASRYFRNAIVHTGLLHRALIIRGSFHELFNLLKLFKSAPKFALAVKQLYICISSRDLGPANLGPGNELPILTAIKDLGMDYRAARRKILPDYGPGAGGPSTRCNGISTDYLGASILRYGTPVYSEERTTRERCIRRYGILVKLILAQMTKLEDIGADIIGSGVLGHGRIIDNTHREFIPNLSHLTSISLRGSKGSGLGSSALNFVMRLRPVKHLYIDTITSKYNPFFTLVGVLYNVTTLILRDSTFIPKDLEMILRRCAPLSIFKYCVTDGQNRSLSLPCEVVATLRAWHGKTLRTLCLRFLPVGGNNYGPGYSSTDSLISSLRGFDVLESLWVDLDGVHGGSSGGPSPANFHTLPWIIGPPECFVESLPGTLKRVFFFVPSRTSGWDDSVVWLARAGDMFPGLTDVLYYNAFRNCTFRMVRRRPYRCPFVPALEWD